MEFLVRITTDVPPAVSAEAEQQLFADERRVGIALRDAGVISRIWTLPGTRCNVGIWVAKDASELHAHLRALPLFRYFTIEVTALATHALEGG